jgi:hypothetical protein
MCGKESAPHWLLGSSGDHSGATEQRDLAPRYYLERRGVLSRDVPYLVAVGIPIRRSARRRIDRNGAEQRPGRSSACLIRGFGEHRRNLESS